jgi:Zn-dependent protease with chaperone function
LGRRQQRVRELSRKGWRVWGLIAGLLAAVWGAAAWFAISQERKERASDNLSEVVLQAGENFVCDLAQLQSNGFSRKLENHAAATALNYFAYNFIKIHRTLRMSPAMAAGVTDRL